jgi:hypothetical protein
VRASAQCVTASAPSKPPHSSLRRTRKLDVSYLATGIICFCFIVYLVSMTFITGGARQLECVSWSQVPLLVQLLGLLVVVTRKGTGKSR